MLKECLVIAALCAASTNLCHAATVAVSVDTNNTIPNIIANSIIADGEGIDWTGGVIRVDLTSGSVYNGAPDSNWPQDAFWAVPGFTQLEWDSWLGIPGDGTAAIGCATECFPPSNMSGTGPYAVNMLWVNTRTTDTGGNRIGNISLTDDARGTWTLITSFAGGVLVQSSGVVINGAMVPEPSALTLLAAGGLVLVKRK